MNKNFTMGLKPLVHPHLTNPFTEVNGNRINTFAVFLPSVLADGLDKLLLKRALATSIILSPKRLIQNILQCLFRGYINTFILGHSSKPGKFDRIFEY